MNVSRRLGLLIVIYLVNVCIGISNSLLGIAWPAMQQSLAVPLTMAGFFSLLVTTSAAVMILFSARLNRHFSTSRIGLAGMLLMALALYGFARTPTAMLLALPAVMLGLSIGSIDSQMNHHIASHYESRHSNWMHAMWGIGATLGPVLMSAQLARDNNWRQGYRTSSIVVGTVAAFFLLTMRLWPESDRKPVEKPEKSGLSIIGENALDTIGKPDSPSDVRASGNAIRASVSRAALGIPGVSLSLVTMLVYCGFEIAIGLWGSSYLVQIHGMAPDMAGRHVSIYFACLTIGRVLSGFLSIWLSNVWLIRISLTVTLAGTGIFFLPVAAWTPLAAFSLIGFGLAAIYPCMIYNTPSQFGRQWAQIIISYQIALGYLGITILPPALGWLAGTLSLSILPLVTLLFTVMLLVATEWLNWIVRRAQASATVRS